MTAIGPYQFSATDQERTLALGRTLFDLLPGGFPPEPDGPAAPYRARAEAALDVLAPHDPAAALGALWLEWRGAMVALRDAGTYGARTEGVVAALFRSHGGVPKEPVDAVAVGWGGVVGDRQDDRLNHGRPWQALCIWSTEVIDAFAAEGHPIAPGSAGENVTVSGLDWSVVRPGVRLLLGKVLCEVSAWALPCKHNRAWFSDGDFNRMHHERGPVSRAYATVLEPGAIATGDPALLNP